MGSKHIAEHYHGAPALRCALGIVLMGALWMCGEACHIDGRKFESNSRWGVICFAADNQAGMIAPIEVFAYGTDYIYRQGLFFQSEEHFYRVTASLGRDVAIVFGESMATHISSVGGPFIIAGGFAIQDERRTAAEPMKSKDLDPEYLDDDAYLWSFMKFTGQRNGDAGLARLATVSRPQNRRQQFGNCLYIRSLRDLRARCKSSDSCYYASDSEIKERGLGGFLIEYEMKER